jgi:ribosome-binding protein aMBF1 (putative translation factor)
MITDDRQYEITTRRAAEFEESLDRAEDRASERHPLLQRALRGALESELLIMYDDLVDYESRRGLQPLSFVSALASDLAATLIRARIMAGLTQRDLGALLGLSERQIRRYEATRYANVPLDRVRAVADALGLKLTVMRLEPHHALAT